MDAAAVDEVRAAAEQTAAQGASLAQAAGFEAQSMAKEATPTWKGIVDAADEHDSSLIVLGSHGRSRPRRRADRQRRRGRRSALATRRAHRPST